MPYVAEENKILTKIRGVSLSEGKEGRQQMLKDMSLHPEHVDIIYVKGVNVYVVYNDHESPIKEWHIGFLKDKYRTLLFNNHAKIVNWYVTGGHKIFSMSDTSQFMARLGINLEIELNPS